MEIREVNYKTESYTISDINRGLTEKDIISYYNDLGYNVTKHYIKYIKGIETNARTISILGDVKISGKVKELFNKYKSGYPDLMLVKGSKVKFVEIKLDGDSLKKSQIILLNELAEIADVSVCYFSNLYLLTRQDYNKITNFTKAQKVILKQLELFTRLVRVHNYKPFWVVTKLYNQFGQAITDDKILGVISNNINQPKKKIVWFINTNLKSAS